MDENKNSQDDPRILTKEGMKHFFLFGLPRSRTAWFANLFTTDKTFCFHEMMHYLHMEDINKFFSIKESIYLYAGNSEPAITYYYGLRELFPDAPVVIIERNKDDSANAFTNSSENLKPHIDKIKEVVDFHHSNIQTIKKIKDQNCMFVGYNELENTQKIIEIWNFCIPDIKPDLLRMQQLQFFEVHKNLKDVKKQDAMQKIFYSTIMKVYKEKHEGKGLKKWAQE